VRLRAASRAEKFLIPAFVFFFFKLYPPAWVISTRNTAAAAGGCMLIRSETLRKIGGIESIRAALIDDCALARRVKSAGGRVWLGTSPLDIRSVREYGRASDIRAMISRSAFAQLNHSTLLLAGTVFGMIIVYIAPALLLLTGHPVAMLLGGAAWALSATIFMPTVREYGVPRWIAFCLPGIALFYLAATIESALRYWSGKGGKWKGRLQDAR
jgi:hopene-associated glycosyltransferase HpnB